jgi:quercetin dioxygenase-like cupin family protein
MKTRRPIVLDADEGEPLWFNNDLLILKATGAQTGGACLLVEEVARQGKVTPLHAHPAEEETFYVLEGEAVIYLVGDERSLGAGGPVSLPPGLPYAYLVTSEVARLLILITPGSGAMEQFFREAGGAGPLRASCPRPARSTSSGSRGPPSSPGRWRSSGLPVWRARRLIRGPATKRRRSREFIRKAAASRSSSSWSIPGVYRSRTDARRTLCPLTRLNGAGQPVERFDVSLPTRAGFGEVTGALPVPRGGAPPPTRHAARSRLGATIRDRPVAAGLRV